MCWPKPALTSGGIVPVCDQESSCMGSEYGSGLDGGNVHHCDQHDVVVDPQSAFVP